MSNIAKAFIGGKALISFITCGDPDLETTGEILRQMSKNGADLIELGIPFSDPTAEGPAVQQANMRALAGGITTDKIFDFVGEIRHDVKTPMVFVTYANVIFSYGTEEFARACAKVGVDGVALTDIPYEEKGEFAPAFKQYGVDLIAQVALASENRTAHIVRGAKGFVQMDLGANGASSQIAAGVSRIVDIIRENTSTPCAIGGGICTPEQAKAIAQHGDGVIVDSAIVNLAAEYGKGAPKKIGAYVKAMKEAII